MNKNPNAVALGRLGGSKTSKAKTEAARQNAQRPRPNRRKTVEQKAIIADLTLYKNCSFVKKENEAPNEA